jgi:hypothetical protein
MRIEQVADFLGCGIGQRRGFRFQPTQLLQRDRDGFGEAIAFGFDFAVGDLDFDNRGIAALGDMSRPDSDARRDTEP